MLDDLASPGEDSWGVQKNNHDRRQSKRENYLSANSRRKSFVQVEVEAGDGLPDEYLNSQMTVLEAPTAMRVPTNCWKNFRCLVFLVILVLVFAAIWLALPVQV